MKLSDRNEIDETKFTWFFLLFLTNSNGSVARRKAKPTNKFNAIDKVVHCNIYCWHAFLIVHFILQWKWSLFAHHLKINERMLHITNLNAKRKRERGRQREREGESAIERERKNSIEISKFEMTKLQIFSVFDNMRKVVRMYCFGQSHGYIYVKIGWCTVYAANKWAV